MMMICEKCGTNNPEGARHCSRCGAALKEKSAENPICLRCGNRLLVPNAKFCNFCGNPVGASDTSGAKLVWSAAVTHKKTEGEVRVYTNRIEYDPRLKKSFYVLRNPVPANTQVTDLRNVETCYNNGSTLVLVMKNGETMEFACSNIQYSELIDAMVKIDSLISGGRPSGASGSEKSFSAYSFVMKITNCVYVHGAGTAVIGTVQKGSIAENAVVSVIDSSHAEKGVFKVEGIAVNRIAAKKASASDVNVALLIPCPITLFSAGDSICIRKH